MTAQREPYWSDEHAAIYNGDAREVLAELGDCSVDCIVTSPPYWGLRHYCDGQYGQEPTLEEYVDNLRATFAEARRVLADDGTFWLNLGARGRCSAARTHRRRSSGRWVRAYLIRSKLGREVRVRVVLPGVLALGDDAAPLQQRP
ncbi:DNA methyltransferase [Microtetraspora malaysiensis]|uniref:site-specific DNA-methyltransferase (cytosine-N(4)-specific) n=1 Tax=Microtetraspora malaysiensis TaxID=161358 RepID=A0ABW6SY04_9ACTN